MSASMPLPAETFAIVPAAVPVVVAIKELVVTPLTLSRKVTRKTTLVTPVEMVLVVGLKRTIVIRGVPWMFSVNIAEDGLVPLAFDAVA